CRPGLLGTVSRRSRGRWRASDLVGAAENPIDPLLGPLSEDPMTRIVSIVMAVSLALAESALGPEALAATVRYGGQGAELSVSSVSERTVQIVLTPLDEKGQARPAPPSTVLVEQQPKLLLRRRALAGPEEVAAGKWRVRVKPEPLTVARARG